MFHHGRDRPELAATLRALNIYDMHQLGTLIKRFEILIAYQRIDPPDNSMSVIFCKFEIFLTSNAVTGDDARNRQHGYGLRGAIAQLLGPGERIQ